MEFVGFCVVSPFVLVILFCEYNSCNKNKHSLFTCFETIKVNWFRFNKRNLYCVCFFQACGEKAHFMIKFQKLSRTTMLEGLI